MNDTYEAKLLMLGDRAAQILVHAEIGGMRRTNFFWSKKIGLKVVYREIRGGSIKPQEAVGILKRLFLSTLPYSHAEALRLRKHLVKA